MKTFRLVNYLKNDDYWKVYFSSGDEEFVISPNGTICLWSHTPDGGAICFPETRKPTENEKTYFSLASEIFFNLKPEIQTLITTINQISIAYPMFGETNGQPNSVHRSKAIEDLISRITDYKKVYDNLEIIRRFGFCDEQKALGINLEEKDDRFNGSA